MLFVDDRSPYMSHKMSRLTIDLPASEHKRLKTAASMMNVSMKRFVLMSVSDFMEKRPNEVTEKTLKQSREGKNLKKFDTLSDLFEDLGI
jgi:hypothetical protein